MRAVLGGVALDQAVLPAQIRDDCDVIGLRGVRTIEGDAVDDAIVVFPVAMSPRKTLMLGETGAPRRRRPEAMPAVALAIVWSVVVMSA